MNRTKLNNRQRDCIYKYLFGLWRTQKELGLILFPDAKQPDSSVSQHLASEKSAAIINYFLEQMVVVDPKSAKVELDKAGENEHNEKEVINDLQHLADCAETYLSENDENSWIGNIVEASDMTIELSSAQGDNFEIIKLLLLGIEVLLRTTERISLEAMEQISDRIERAILSCQLNRHDKELQFMAHNLQDAFFSKMSDVWKHATESPEYARRCFAIYSKVCGAELPADLITKFCNTIKRKKYREKSYTPLTNTK